jgi:hypothetical protein
VPMPCCSSRLTGETVQVNCLPNVFDAEPRAPLRRSSAPASGWLAPRTLTGLPVDLAIPRTASGGNRDIHNNQPITADQLK